MEKDKMTLRDQFAMAAMSGFLSNREMIASAHFISNDHLACTSYDMADAMLKAREINSD